MVRNEADFRDIVANLLEKEGYSIEKEYKVPEGYRVDILAEKENSRIGVEVKLDRRGINHDISKGSKLLQIPEFDEVYVAAPGMLISPEHYSFAKQTGLGIIEVYDDSLNFKLTSSRPGPATFGWGGSIVTTNFNPGSIFEVSYHVKNDGQKLARNVRLFFISSGPFVRAPGAKQKFKKSVLMPQEDWRENFKVKIRKNAKPGKNPLHFGYYADEVEPSGLNFEIEIPAHE